MSAEIIEATKEEETVDAQKRAFMGKFGKYAVAGAGMAILMAPSASHAGNYDQYIDYDPGTGSYTCNDGGHISPDTCQDIIGNLNGS